MTMNKKQKYVLIVVCSVIFLMLFCPPFYRHTPSGETCVILNDGYNCIFSPPDNMSFVDIKTLLTQWLGVLMIGGISWVLLMGHKNSNTSTLKESLE